MANKASSRATGGKRSHREIREGDRVRYISSYLRKMRLFGPRGAHWQMEGVALGVTTYPDYRTRCKTIVTVEWSDGNVSRVFQTLLNRV